MKLMMEMGDEILNFYTGRGYVAIRQGEKKSRSYYLHYNPDVAFCHSHLIRNGIQLFETIRYIVIGDAIQYQKGVFRRRSDMKYDPAAESGSTGFLSMIGLCTSHTTIANPKGWKAADERPMMADSMTAQADFLAAFVACFYNR